MPTKSCRVLLREQNPLLFSSGVWNTARMQFKGNTDQSSAHYWDDLAELYQKETRISTDDFHYGPLLPGDSKLNLLPTLGKNQDSVPDGFQCLEIGCCAGQNSIFLARQGARCIATDISKEQLAHGQKLAAAEKVEVDFRCISMDSLRESLPADHAFDLIHSTYALPFAADPKKVIADAAAMLKPGGVFLLTTGHPLYTGEWLDLGDGEDGLFLPDYFRPEPDVRMSLDDRTLSAAQTWPVSTIAEWLHAAGLAIERMLEPEPLPIPEMSEAEIRATVPYESNDWRELYPQLARTPIVMIFKTVRKSTQIV